MNNAAQQTQWPTVSTDVIDTRSEFWKHECLAIRLAHCDDNTFASWVEKNQRKAAFVHDITQRIAAEHSRSLEARQLLRTRPHREIREWLQTLSEPHRTVWANRFTREKQAIKEAPHGEH